MERLKSTDRAKTSASPRILIKIGSVEHKLTKSEAIMLFRSLMRQLNPNAKKSEAADKNRRICENCGCYFHGRSDAVTCSARCRHKLAYMDVKIEEPVVPQSGVPGIIFKRRNRTWAVNIKLEGKWKYIGCKKDLEAAIALQKETMTDDLL